MVVVIVAFTLLGAGMTEVLSGTSSVQLSTENISVIPHPESTSGSWFALETADQNLIMGGNLAFAYHDFEGNITLDLLETDNGDWLTGEDVIAIAYDSVHEGAYILSRTSTNDNLKIGYYNSSSGTSDVMSNPFNIDSITNAEIIFIPNEDAVLIASQTSSGQQLIRYSRPDDAFFDYAPVVDSLPSAGSLATSNMGDLDFDPSLNIAYLSNIDGDGVIEINLSSDTARILDKPAAGSIWLLTHDDSGGVIFGDDYGYDSTDAISVYDRVTDSSSVVVTGFPSSSLQFNQDMHFNQGKLFFGMVGIPTQYIDFENGYAITDLSAMNEDVTVLTDTYAITSIGSLTYFAGAGNDLVEYHPATYDSGALGSHSVLFSTFIGLIILFTGIAIAIYCVKHLSGAK